MSFLSRLFGPKVAAVKPVVDEPEPERVKPAKVEHVPVTSRVNYRKFGRAKYDPLYLKKAVQACRAARQRMGIE